MKSLEVSLYNLSFLILTKRGRVHNLFTHAFVVRLAVFFLWKIMEYLWTSLRFRLLFDISVISNTSFYQIQDYQKQDRWTTAQEFYLSLRFPSIPSSFFSHRLFPGRFISFIFFILPSDVPGIRLPSLPASSPPLQAPALPPGWGESPPRSHLPRSKSAQSPRLVLTVNWNL